MILFLLAEPGIQVQHTGITVSDIDYYVDIFTRLFGFSMASPVCLYDDPKFELITGVKGARIKIAFLELDGFQIELLEYLVDEAKRKSDLEPCNPGHMHLNFKVTGIENYFDDLVSEGFKPAGEIQYVEQDNLKAIYLTGPDNIVIELMEFMA